MVANSRLRVQRCLAAAPSGGRGGGGDGGVRSRDAARAKYSKSPDPAPSLTLRTLLPATSARSFIRTSPMGLFPYSTEAYFQCDCCWKAFPPSPEGPFRPGAAVVMGLEEAWSVSTSGAEQDGAPATHQPRRYCPASQRPTPGARQWRRCSKLSQE